MAPSVEGSSEGDGSAPPAAAAAATADQPIPGSVSPHHQTPPGANTGGIAALLQAANDRRDSTASDTWSGPGWITVDRHGRRHNRGNGGRGHHGNRGNHHGANGGAGHGNIRHHYGGHGGHGSHGSRPDSIQHAAGRRGSETQVNGDPTTRPRIRFFGTATEGVLRGGPPPKRDYFISRLHTSTQDNVIKDYLKDNGLSNFDLQLVSNSVSTFKSYKLSVSMDDKDKVLQPTLWPKGVLVKKWFQKSRYYNQERHGESSNG